MKFNCQVEKWVKTKLKLHCDSEQISVKVRYKMALNNKFFIYIYPRYVRYPKMLSMALALLKSQKKFVPMTARNRLRLVI